MPNMPRKLIILLAYSKLLFRPGWIMPKPIYTATGLLFVAGLLMISVISSLQQAAVPPESARNMPLVGEAQPKPIEQPAVIVQSQAELKPEPAKAQTPPSAPAVSVAAQRSAVKENPRWPIKGKVIGDFGWQQHAVYQDWRYHAGIDILADKGQLVQAIFSGEVEDIFTDKNYGLTAAVKSGQYTIYYGSLSSIAVSKGSSISGGDNIGTVGSANAEPEIHLHLGIKSQDKFIDPRSLLN